MNSTNRNRRPSILVIRLGALGDILHALPAVASLKKSFPGHEISWLVARKWLPLLEGNPCIDRLIPFERRGMSGWLEARRELRKLQPEMAIDFQGLVQSALLGRVARAGAFFGFDRSVAREPLASRFYSVAVHVTGPHRIERNLQLVCAAGAAGKNEETWLPPGTEEGDLPAGPFVLTSPFAGWNSKQWPLAYYEALGKRLEDNGLQLVANLSPQRVAEMGPFQHVHVHCSSLSGLICATRRASAVVGVDSGPLHLAAALQKPGVALFGPTDPAQTGPFRSPMTVLRAEDAQTTYKRSARTHPSMAAISVEQVLDAVSRSLAAHRTPEATAIGL